MSNYAKITDYAAKDVLLTGNPSKIVKGSEIGADFDAIVVAVATKANSASPVFTGVSNFAAGTVGAPSIYLSTDTTTGWYRIGANNLGLAVSGAKVLDIASTGLGVTGTLSATGNSILGSGSPLTAGGSARWITLNSDVASIYGGGVISAIDGVAKGYFYANSSTAVVIQGAAGVNVELMANNSGTPQAVVSSTGLAVTGTITATDNFVIALGKKLYYSATAYVTPDDNVTGAVLAGTSAASIKVNGSNVAVATSAGLAVTGTLSATGEITETTGAAWTAYTPTISADTGSFTGQTINSARYRVLGKTLFISISVSSTGVTGAPTQMRITAPGAQTYGTSAQNIACPITSGGTAEIGTVRAYDALGFIVERCGATAFTGATAATFNGVFETE